MFHAEAIDYQMAISFLCLRHWFDFGTNFKWVHLFLSFNSFGVL